MSSNSPCAACKCLRRKCTQDCPFAPYFPPDNPKKFTSVHTVFGASNVAKLLNELNPSQREDAVNSLAYEAECRLRDPVYGCVGFISILQHKLKQVQHDLENAKKELATYIGPTAMLPLLNHPGLVQQQQQQNYNYAPSAYPVMPYNNQLPTGIPHGAAQMMIREPHDPQFLEAQQLAAVAAREQEMLRTYEQQQQHQNDIVRFNSGGFDDAAGAGFDQVPGAAAMQPSLALGNNSYETLPYHHIQQHSDGPVPEHSHSHHPNQLQLQLQPHELLLQQQQTAATPPPQQHQLAQPQTSLSQHQQLPRAKSEEGTSIGP